MWQHFSAIKPSNRYVYFCSIINLQARFGAKDIHGYATFWALQAGNFAQRAAVLSDTKIMIKDLASGCFSHGFGRARSMEL